MDKKNPKKKSKSKSKEKSPKKNIIKKSKPKKQININNKSKVKSTKKNSPKNKNNNKSKSKTKKSKKNKSKEKNKEKKILEENDTIMITQKLDGKMFIKNKKEKKIEKKIEKTFSEIKIGTPHFDINPYYKKILKEKENSIKELKEEKKIMIEKFKIIYNKLDNISSLLNTTPEQDKKITILYYLLNLNKKNHINSTTIKNKYRTEYMNLLIKNNYDPMEKLNEYGNKITLSIYKNFEITKEIEKLKNINITSKSKIKDFSKKENMYEKYLINELNALNKQKYETLIKIKNNKKIINSSIIKFKNLVQIYDENKIINININPNPKIIKLEKDIDLLKNDLLIKNENELYNRIYNNQILINNNFNRYIFKLKTNNNNSEIQTVKKLKNLRKNHSTESLKTNLNYLNNSEEINMFKKKLIKKNIFPKINNSNDTKNRSMIKEQNESENIKINKNITNYEELTDIKKNEINYLELNFKKEYYNIISIKLDNSIKDMENMYKRKIKNIEELLNTNQKKYLDIKKRNDLLKIEIENLHKIIHIQVKEFIENTEKKNISDNLDINKTINN